MARQPSAILTPAQQKTVDSVAALKAQIKTETATAKELNKYLSNAKKAADKQNTLVSKLAAKLTKLTPAKPAVTVVEQIAKAA